MDPLTDPSVYEELESLKQHSVFICEQTRKDNEKLLLTTAMLQTGEFNEADIGVVKKLQAEVMDKVRNLDETTRRIQTLLGLPSVDVADIQVNKLESDKLGANPIASDKVNASYGILERLPKLALAGDHQVQLTTGTAKAIRPRRGADVQEISEDEEERLEIQLQARDRLQEILERKRKAKEAQVKRLQEANRILKETLKKLRRPDALAMSISSGHPPRNDEEADGYLRALNNEREKIEKLKGKVKNELRQQYRANQLINNGRHFPEEQIEVADSDWSRLFDLDTEISLNNEQLAYKKIKKERKRKTEENNQLRRKIENLLNQNDELRDKIELVNQERKTLDEILDEMDKTKSMELELGVVEKELNKAYEKIGNMHREHEDYQQFLQEQKRTALYYRDKFMETQEEFETTAILICQEEKEHEARVCRAKREIQCFRSSMENQLDMYRPIPFILGVTLIQAFQIENQTQKIVGDSKILERELAAHLTTAEELLDQLRQHEHKVEAYKAKQNRVKQLRDNYEDTEHVLNQHRKTNAAKTEKLEYKLNRIQDKEKEIKELRDSIENLKEAFAKKHFLLHQEDEIKKQARLIEIHELEMETAKKRGRVNLSLAECSDDAAASPDISTSDMICNDMMSKEMMCF